MAINLALSLRIAMIFANLAIVSVWLLMARFAHAYTIQDAIDAKETIVNKDTKNIKRLLKQFVINKPEKNMWNNKNSETPTRAFYYTGG